MVSLDSLNVYRLDFLDFILDWSFSDEYYSLFKRRKEGGQSRRRELFCYLLLEPKDDILSWGNFAKQIVNMKVPWIEFKWAVGHKLFFCCWFFILSQKVNKLATLICETHLFTSLAVTTLVPCNSQDEESLKKLLKE